MNLLITICARGGSKGIPNKNIKPIANLPLIAYSINCAKAFAQKHNAFLALSTDSKEIKHIANLYYQFDDYERPNELATDTAGKLPVLIDILNYTELKNKLTFDYLLDLDVTSPLRNMEDLDAAFEVLKNSSNGLNLFSVNHANRNPYFNMVEENENGFYSLIKDLPDNVTSRQAAPKVYDLNASFYFYKRSFFTNQSKTAIGKNSLIYIMPHTCFDLDEPIDFDFMEYLIENNKLDFKL
jgi:CMP-N,N'-diacetyllegionaminic acid synthase